MNSQPNSKIIGAFLVGFALVAATYTLTNFGQTNTSLVKATQPAAVAQQAAPLRTAIAVSDEDGNGIEDWRDDFISTEPIILNSGDEEYTVPDTITGQLGINFVQEIVRGKAYGQFGRTQEDIIQDTITQLERDTSHAIFDTQNIIVKNSWQGSDIKNYANAVATVILSNTQVDLDNELLILRDVMNRNDISRIEELETLAEVYRVTRDSVLKIEVPSILVKEHLDLINTLHAVHNDIVGMSLAYEDPAYSLLRLKRYEDDVLGMSTALTNLYLSLEPYASLFSPEDSAVFFVSFSPRNDVRI